MSFTINHVSLVGGNLVRDAEMKYTGGGTPVLNFDIAMNRSWKNKDTNEIQEEVSYFRVNYWGKPAESVQKFLTKGKKVAIEGRMQQRRWEGPDGKTNSVVEVVASSVILMGSDIQKETNQQPNVGNNQQPNFQQPQQVANNQPPIQQQGFQQPQAPQQQSLPVAAPQQAQYGKQKQQANFQTGSQQIQNQTDLSENDVPY